MEQREFKKGVDFVGVTIAYVCHDGNGNILLAKRSKNCRDEHGRWENGAGGLEFGDSIEKTLRKELTEEYCVEPIQIVPLGYRELHRTHEGRPTHWIAIDFKILIDPTKVRNGEPHKFDDMRWFPLDHLPGTEELHSQLPKLLEKYGKEFFRR